MTSCFNLLNKLMEKPDKTVNSNLELSCWSEKILNEIIISNLVWKAGKKAMYIRSIATEFFLKLLSSVPSNENDISFISKKELQNQLEKRIIPILISNLDEDIVKARKESLIILSILFSNLNFEGGPFLYFLIFSRTIQDYLSRTFKTP